MGLSKEHKIQILLVIDVAFFLLELTVGYAVHSLALVADSFHMLNDVISLLVGLWAVRVANQKTNSNIYTYGWQRAETLGALVNGVFLVALCLSIFLEAIQRFVEPQEVSHPKLVLIVGCFGLASNILGLFLFHDHGHSHGGHSHDEISNAEEGHSHGHTHDADAHDHGAHVSTPVGANGKTKKDISWGVDTASEDVARDGSKTPRRSASGRRISKSSKSSKNSKGHGRSRSRGYSTIDEIYVHPSSFRQNIIEASRMDPDEYDSDSGAQTPAEGEASEQSPLLQKSKGSNAVDSMPKKRDCHSGHKHNQPKTASSSGGHGHSHGDLNMRGVFLHVLGDALGNVGVIASALFIWLTDFSWRFYADPLISLIITVIILLSAIPLCKAASRILLQAVPAHLDIEEIKTDIVDLDGIISVHHLHVWQLTEKRLVASLHVQFGFGFSDEGSVQYMALIKEIQKCLHEYGIHHATIQPEFCLNPEHDHSGASSADEGHRSGSSHKGSGKNSKSGSVQGNNDCLLECSSGCGNNTQKCYTREGNGCSGK